MSARVVKPSARAARSQDSRIARPRPRRVQSPRTDIARTRAGSVRGSSSRASSSDSPAPASQAVAPAPATAGDDLAAGLVHVVRAVLDEDGVELRDVALRGGGLAGVVEAREESRTERA